MSDVIDRIVERNRLFWFAVFEPGTASDDERRAALDRSLQADPFAVKQELRCPHGKQLWERCFTCQFDTSSPDNQS
jgi:hypothetical protein